MKLDILQIFSLLDVFISLLLAVFLLTIKSKNYLSNILLALFLIIHAQDSDSIFLGSYIYPNFPATGLLIKSTVLLQMPILYLYLLSVIYSDFKLKRIHLLHTLPFIFGNLILIPGFYLLDFDGKLEFLGSLDGSQNHIEIKIIFVVLHIQAFSYLIFSFLIVNKYRRLLLENFSNASLFNYKWFFQFISILSIGYLIATMKNLFLFFGTEETFYYSMLITSFVALFYITWFVFKVMRHPELFRGIDSKLQLVNNLIKEESEQENINEIKTKLNEKIIEKDHVLNKFMIEEEPFLNPSLSIYDLAKQINMPTRELSLLINHDLNQHFFDFVNGFRIRKAMEILADPDKNDLTVLEILYDVGFNSKSSFNTAFKKYTQLTPTDYRKKHLSSAA
jgi:AraC-like DNA-binding protein